MTSERATPNGALVTWRPIHEQDGVPERLAKRPATAVLAAYHIACQTNHVVGIGFHLRLLNSCAGVVMHGNRQHLFRSFVRANNQLPDDKVVLDALGRPEVGFAFGSRERDLLAPTTRVGNAGQPNTRISGQGNLNL